MTLGNLCNSMLSLYPLKNHTRHLSEKIKRFRFKKYVALEVVVKSNFVISVFGLNKVNFELGKILSFVAIIVNLKIRTKSVAG